MALIPPDKETTVSKIWEHWAKQESTLRPTLGVSELGLECERALWFRFRWFKLPEFEPRLLRLFDHGKREEVRVFEDLRAIGVTIDAFDSNGGQWSFKEISGHLSGSMDAVIQGIPESKQWHVLEIKTHNDKSFKDLQKNGVKKSKYQHYVQMQVYMGLTSLDRAMYFAVNKNDDDIYTERIDFDKSFYSNMLEKAKRIIYSDLPLSKINDHPSFYVCKMCSFNSICHNNGNFLKNCRTCVNSKPVEDGKWRCNKLDKNIEEKEQLSGCDNYEAIKVVPKRGY